MESFLKRFFFSLISPIFYTPPTKKKKKKKKKKESDKSNFSWLAQLFKHFLKLLFNTKLVSQKRNDQETLICLTPKPIQSFFVYGIQSKYFLFLLQKSFLRERGSEGLNKKTKRKAFLTAFATVIKKDPHKPSKKAR